VFYRDLLSFFPFKQEIAKHEMDIQVIWFDLQSMTVVLSCLMNLQIAREEGSIIDSSSNMIFIKSKSLLVEFSGFDFIFLSFESLSKMEINLCFFFGSGQCLLKSFDSQLQIFVVQWLLSST
jgi:hypothetical protein